MSLDLGFIKMKEKKLHQILLNHNISGELERKRIIVEVLEELFKV